MDAVAREAGVGRTTVFEQFRSKTALFQAVSDDLRRQVFAAKFGAASSDGVDARLASALRGGQELWNAELDLFRRLHGMALLEPASAESTSSDVRERRAQVEALARELVAAGRVRAGVSESDLADALSLLSGFAAYSSLRRARSDASAVGRLLELLLSGLLLPGN